ncbi:MAG: histone deacetylase [Candidatus Sumerlaeaceae bacterium]|nr:histone deacetylase [Candidatus Sumerlaeaceae bacterium]
MKYIYSENYRVNIGAHVFPTAKYSLIRQRLLNDDIAAPADFVEPEPATTEELRLVHTQEFLDDLTNCRWTSRTRHSELPLTDEIVRAYVTAAGGSILAARLALTTPDRICVHIGGGFHHAFADRAEGFCYLNDIAIAIRQMQREGHLRRAMVVDCDLHQGNGTAHIFQEDADVFTISLHQEHNYPLKQRSDIDVGLDDYTADADYLAALRRVFPEAAERHKPELIVYVAGADPYEQDQLGNLKLTFGGLEARDRQVLEDAARLRIPSIVVLAGGYAANTDDTVRIHTTTCKVASEVAARNATTAP